MWEKSESSHKSIPIHVWKEKGIITDTELDSRVKRKVNHHRNRTRFTCEKVNHHRNRIWFTCEKMWIITETELWERSESSQKPNSIHVWKKWIITETELDFGVWKKWIIPETERWQYLDQPSYFTRAWDQHNAIVDPEADLSRHGTRINSKVKNIINYDLRWSTITTTQRPISNYLRKTWPRKVTITATRVTNRTGCELPQRCYWTVTHMTNQTPLQRKADFFKMGVPKPWTI